ncbi:VOC family protein [Rhodococcus fascians]|nr:VOC family protein [Rhodococcus fascians]
MKMDRLEFIGVVVADLEEGVRRFSEVLGLEFDIVDTTKLDVQATDGVVPDERAPQSGMRVALDASGTFELVEVEGMEEGFRNVHFRVDDLEEAIATLSARGMRLVRQFVVGGMKEAIFAAEDLYGIRVCLLEYEGDSLGDAMRQAPG